MLIRLFSGLSAVAFSACLLSGCGGSIEAGMPTDFKTPTAMPNVTHIDMKDIMKQGKAARMHRTTGRGPRTH